MDVISVFFRVGGHNFDRLRRGGGAKNERKKFVCAKTQKVTIFQIQGGGKCPPPCPPSPQMTSLVNGEQIVLSFKFHT